MPKDFDLENVEVHVTCPLDYKIEVDIEQLYNIDWWECWKTYETYVDEKVISSEEE